MVDALDHLGQIQPEACRRRAEKRFDVPRMADDYVAAYERILDAGAHPARRTAAGSSGSPDAALDSLRAVHI